MAKNRRAFIKHYMQEKSNEVKRQTGLTLYFIGDYKDLTNLTKKQVVKVYKELCDDPINHDDINACPQCIIYNDWYNDCEECTYGIRHGVCHIDDGRYQKITDKLPYKAIVDSITSKVIKRLIYWNTQHTYK